jgi:hypothetical protein
MIYRYGEKNIQQDRSTHFKMKRFVILIIKVLEVQLAGALFKTLVIFKDGRSTRIGFNLSPVDLPFFPHNCSGSSKICTI